jgi:hypothetical protein
VRSEDREPVTIEDRLASLEARLDALERRAESPSQKKEAEGTPPVDTAAELEWTSAVVPEMAFLAGRSLLVLAGAYLLRALTAGGLWPAGVGVIAGLVYASIALLWADHDAARGRSRSAVFHAAVACSIAFPLIWESRRLAGLPDEVVAVLWLGFVVGTQAVARRRESRAILAALVLIASPIGVALVPETRGSAPAGGALLVALILAAVVEAPAGAAGLMWVPLVLADALALILSLTAWGDHAAEWLAPTRVAIGQWTLWAGFAAVSVYPGRRATGRARAQAFVALVFLTLGVGLPWPTVGARRFMAAGVALAGLWSWAGTKGSGAGHSASRLVALVALVVGSGVAVADPARAILWAALALGASAVAARRPTAEAAAVFGAALAWSTGLLPGSGGIVRPVTAVLAELILCAAAWRLTQRGDMDVPRLGASAVVQGAALGGWMALGLHASSMGPASLDAVVAPAWPMLGALGLLAIGRVAHLRLSQVIGALAVIAVGGRVLVADVFGGTPERQFAGLASLGFGLLAATMLLRQTAAPARIPR